MMLERVSKPSRAVGPERFPIEHMESIGKNTGGTQNG